MCSRGGGDLVLPSGAPWQSWRTLFVRRTAADGRLAADQAGLVGDRLGGEYGELDGVGVMAVAGDDVPAVGLETRAACCREPALDMAVDGDAIVVPEGDQLAETEVPASEQASWRDAFHQAAVAEKGVGVVIDDLVAGRLNSAASTFGERHADRIGDALAERAGGRLTPTVMLYSGCPAVFE